MGRSTRTTNEPRGAAHGFGDQVEQIRHDAHALSTALQTAATDVEQYLTEHVQQKPWRSLAIAAGLGYVLGGGLRSRLTSLILGAGARLGMAIAAREIGERIGVVADTLPSKNLAPVQPDK